MNLLDEAIFAGNPESRGAAAWAVLVDLSSPLSQRLLMMLAGAGVGIGIWLVILGARRRRPKLADLLAAPNPATSGATAYLTGFEASEAGNGLGARALRLGMPAARALARRGFPASVVAVDLRIVERPVLVHLAMKTVLAVAGLCLPALAAIPLALTGAGTLPLWACVGAAVLGWVTPDLHVRQIARRRRDELRRAVGTVLDLTAIALAGGAGVEQALTGAAAVGTGWAHEKIRAALDGAVMTRSDPWVALGRLGTALGVDELSELAAVLLLAGTEGARIRASLTAKAASLRAHQQTRDEAAAAAATERMSLPAILLFAGYLVFIGYPALTRVLTSF